MANIWNISGNTFGDHITILQGSPNTANPDAKNPIDKDKSLIKNTKDFLQKIAQTDPFDDRKRILDLKGPFLHESFNWILDHDSFEKWRCTRESGVLWIKGDPGKGKTMLLCGIINELEQHPGINANLSYFFCQATDSRINTATSVIGALIFVFMKRVQQLLLHLINEYQDKLDRCRESLPIAAEYDAITRGYNDKATQPRKLLSFIHKKYGDKLDHLNGPNGLTILCDLFIDVARSPAVSDPVCIVDALDECEHNSKSLLSLIVKTNGHVKWLISSRNVKDIERGLRLIEPGRRLNLELKENAERISRSVDVYIEKSITDIHALKDDEDLQSKTTKILREKANGTFLWVALVIEQLRDIDHRHVEEVLEELPEGLESLYDLIMSRANSKLRQKDQEACQILLSIITTAERPLRLEELHTFIRFQWAHYKSSYNALDMKDIVRDCGSFLAIRDDIIYFIHQSVKDYIVGNAYNSIFPSGIQYQHQKMFETSMNAISRILKNDIYNLKDPQRHINNVTSPDPDPLVPIAYSCIFWIEHLIRGYDSGGFKAEECFKDDGLLHNFLKTKYLCWLEALALLRRLTPEGESILQRLNKLAAIYYRSKTNGHQVTNSKKEKKETNCFIKLIGDAYRFFRYCQHFVKKWPLQLYYSAIVFEDKYGTIHKTYGQSIRAHFGNLLTFIKKPQRGRSLQRNIDIRGSVAKLLYSPDSSTLCVLFDDLGSISLYRTDIMECAIQLSVDKKHRHYVSFSPDSKHLVSVSHIGIVQTWAIDSEIQVRHLVLDPGMSKPRIFSREEVVGLSPHGDLAASMFCRSDKYLSSMRIWTTETGACAREIDLMYKPILQSLFVFAPNSAQIALTYDSGVSIYSTWMGEAMKHIHLPTSILYPNRIKRLKFSQDSALLALVYDYSDICLWCTKEWTKIYQIKLGDSIQDFDLSLDASMFVAVLPQTLVFGSTRRGEQLLKIGTGDDTEKVSFSPDWPTSSLLASANSNAVQIWRVDTKDSSAEMRSTACFDSIIAISPGSKYVAARSREGYINIWSGKSGECIQALESRDQNGDPVEWARPVFSPNLEFVAYAEGNPADVRIWRLTTGESLHLLESHNGSCNIHAMIFSDDSKYLVTGYDTKEVKVWCTESGKCLFKSDENDDADSNDDHNDDLDIVALAISPDAKYVARASRRVSMRELYLAHAWAVRIWDWRVGHDISSFDPEQAKRGNNFHIESLGFSSDATVLTVISIGDMTDSIPTYEAQIWEVATGTFISCVAVGKSFSVPLFDSIANKILTDRAGFCRRSSWGHWEMFPRRAYSLWQPNLDRSWICFGGEKIFLVPEEFSPKYSFENVAMSSSLLAYTTSADEIMIIQLPNQHQLHGLGIITLDPDNVGESSLRAYDSNSEVVSYLATGKFDPDEPQDKKRLKLSSYLLE